MQVTTNNNGFTLVELMVVVAIIGILSTVAVPNFKRYQAKAKTSEAKLILASTYTNEISFMSEWDTFATCLGTGMGMERPARGYYSFGFAAENAGQNTIAVNNGASGCVAGTYSFSPVNIVAVGGSSATSANIMATALIPVGGATFLASAVGKISSDSTENDQWTIDDDKALRNVTPGF